MEHKYVLREKDQDEIDRLKFQHQVWKEETDFAIAKTRVFDGEKVIDLGSGPGYLSYDLLELTCETGEIFCVDNSELFIKFIKDQNLKNVHPVKLDIRNELLNYFDQSETIDKVFCRWVLMFIGDIEKTIGEVYELLKPGGKFVSIEYFNFKQISMFPKSEAFDKIYQNVWKLLTQNGGNPDIGNLVYKVMREKGFKNLELFPLYKTGVANSDTWKWLEQTNVNHQNLVDAGLINQKELELFYSDWDDKSMDELSFIAAPPLMITIGEK